MKSFQRGIATTTVAGVLAILATLAGLAYGGYSYGTYKQEVKTKEVANALTLKEAELKEANGKIRDLKEKNEKLEADLKLLNDIIEVNKKVAMEREAEIKNLKVRIGVLEKKLPKTRPRDPSKPLDPVAEKASMERYDVLHEVYLTVLEDPYIPPEPADSHKDPGGKEGGFLEPPIDADTEMAVNLDEKVLKELT